MRSLPLSLALALGVPAFGAPAEPAASSQFLHVIGNAPALQAAAQRAAAAHERVRAAGRLPDPELEGMGSQMNGPMDEETTMWGVSLRQPLPKKGERAADRERAQAAAAMARAEYALMAGEMAADTAMALAEARGAEERISLLKAQVERLQAVQRSIEVRLSAGNTGRIADRLTLETRIASMQLMIEEETRMAADALADARGRLGLPADHPLPSYQAPAPTEVSPDRAAAAQLAAARADEANAMIKMARASGRPMTAVGVNFQREKTAMGNEDTVGLAFMSELPWRSRRYARAEVRAAQADRAAAQTEGAAVKYQLSSALSRVARAQQLAETARRLNAETQARLNAEYDAMIRAASVGTMGQSTVLETVELLEKATETELQINRADTAARVAQAALWRFVPVTQFPLSNDPSS